MSLIAAIDTAVRLQLADDNTPNANDYSRVMGPDIAAAGAQPAIPGFGYDEARLAVFLQKVSRRLKFDSPSLAYDWTKSSLPSCLTANRETLIDVIASATTKEG